MAEAFPELEARLAEWRPEKYEVLNQEKACSQDCFVFEVLTFKEFEVRAKKSSLKASKKTFAYFGALAKVRAKRLERQKSKNTLWLERQRGRKRSNSNKPKTQATHSKPTPTKQPSPSN